MSDEQSAPSPPGQRPTVNRGGLWGLMFSAAGLLLLPYGAVLCVLGIVQGIRTRNRARSEGSQAPGAVLSIVTGILGVLWGLNMGVAVALLSDELSTLAECTSRANTVSAQERCEAEFQESFDERFADSPWLARWAELTVSP